MERAWDLLRWFSVLNCVLCTLAATPPASVLLVAFDGLRWDFVNNEYMPNFWRLAQEGVWGKYGVKPQYRTVTTANFYSISTGLYEESHGIMDNKMYDPETKMHFDYWDFSNNSAVAQESRRAYWYQAGTPIWLLNQQQDSSPETVTSSSEEHAMMHMNHDSGQMQSASQPVKRYSGCFNWPTCDSEHSSGAFAHFLKPPLNLSSNLEDWKREFDTVVSWYLNATTPINLGLYYVQEPDETQHHHDIYGPVVRTMLSNLDSLVGYMRHTLEQKGLWGRLNIIFTADHGHTVVKKNESYIDLTAYLNETLDKLTWTGFSIFPNDTAGVDMDWVYDRLKEAEDQHKGKLFVYKKADFPSRYHYAKNARVGDIIVQPEMGYEIYWNRTWYNKTIEHGAIKDSVFGDHGFLNDEKFENGKWKMDMNALFVATGPAFNQRFVLEDHIENIDIYPLICEILKLRAPANNGSLERVKKLLSSATMDSNQEAQTLLGQTFLTAVIIGVVVLPVLALFCYCLVCTMTPLSVGGARAVRVDAEVRETHGKHGVNSSNQNKPLLLLENERSTSEDEL